MPRHPEALRSTSTDEGFSLVEVIVAMLVLGLVASGIAAGTAAVVRMTADNRARQVAVNLAEQQLDTARGTLDPLKIFSGTSTQSVSGRTYTVVRTTSLVSTTGNDISCGSGQTIDYRRISVQVTWTGMLPTTSPVQSDTIMAPNGRINDASTGSVAVMVTGSDGTGESGVSVTITPAGNGATTLQSQPAVTDVDGCSYALGVNPGTYKVAIQRAGGIDVNQVAAPSNDTLPVVAGSTSPATFSYDDAAAYSLSYADGVAVLPTAMGTTLLGSGAPYITSTTSAPRTALPLYPYPAGYTAIAGAEADTNGNVTCAAEDPAAWAAGKWTGKTLKAGTRGTTAAAPPGGSAALTVPMGVFTVTTPTSATPIYIQAVGQSVTQYGQPGCRVPETFVFPAMGSNQSVRLALPYGTYQISYGTSVNNILTMLGVSLRVGTVNLSSPTATVPTNSPLVGPLSGVTSNGVLTLDPRNP